MKFVLQALLGVALLCCLSVAFPQQYTSKFDNVNVDSILKNDRVVNNYIKCLLDKGPCTQEGRELKRTLPDAIITDCSKCSATQRANTEKVVKYLRERKSKEWKELLAKFDPSGKSRAKYGL